MSTEISKFCEEVLAGDAAKTLQLVSAVNSLTSSKLEALSNLKLIELRSSLQHRNAASRNRALRRWMGEITLPLLVAFWVDLGFPVPEPSPLSLIETSAGFRRLCVFDFDCTLAAKEAGPTDVATDVCLERCWGGSERASLIVAMLNELSQIPGEVALAVVSFNSCTTVRKALKTVGLDSLFLAVFGSEDFEKIQGCERWEKSSLIKSELLPFLGNEMLDRRCSVCFVDDNESNIRDIGLNLGATTIYVNGNKGMRSVHIEKVLHWYNEQVKYGPASPKKRHLSTEAATSVPDHMV